MQKTTIALQGITYIGETIEQKVRRITINKEPIKDGAPLIYQERHEGIDPLYDIRTDRFEQSLEATDVRTITHRAKTVESLNKIGEEAKKAMEVEDLQKNTDDKGEKA